MPAKVASMPCEPSRMGSTSAGTCGEGCHSNIINPVGFAFEAFDPVGRHRTEENGAPVEGDLANLKHFYDRGIRYITLTHGRDNQLSDSSYDTTRTWQGLSPFGLEVVDAMNRLGMIVDISHLSDSAATQVLRRSRAPVFASHSSARHFTPGWERNMSDEMIVRLAENGGLIMINFGSAFISEESWRYGEAFGEAYDAWLEETGTERSDEARRRFNEQYSAEYGSYPFSTLDQVLDHFDHVIELTGVDYVGIGSDYDGVGDTLPIGLKDVSDYPNLINGLLDRGYSVDEFAVDLWRYFSSGTGGTSDGLLLQLRPGRNRSLWLLDSDGERRQITGISFQQP